MTRRKRRSETRTLWRGISEALLDPGVRLLLMLTLTVILLGGLFYSFIEGWAFIDAVYFSTVTIATIGYGDFSPQTVIGKIFTIGYIVVGIGLFVALASAVADHLIRRTEKDLDRSNREEGPEG